jgi:uncharacterized protein involved in type VI secretion and phage assembly
MSALDLGLEQHGDTRFYGVAVGQVTSNQDPRGLGRVKLKFPWWSDNDESHWARIACFMAGPERGAFFLPEVDDEVLVAFEHGDIHRPYVIGALWNGQAKPPADNANGNNDVRLIKSRSGHLIRLDDTEGSEKIEIIDKEGTNSITIDSKQNTVTIKADKDMVIEAPRGKISLTAQKIEIKSSADTKVQAQANMDVKASGTLTVKGATVNIN